jgi:hypothetical protein
VSSRLGRAALVTGASLAFGCGNDAGAPSDGGSADTQAQAFDLCDAFTGVGTSCAVAGPTQCFALCDGGCACGETADGPRWTCAIDFSCVSMCAPIDVLEGTCGATDAAVADAASE